VAREREVKAWSLAVAGRTHTEIAKELGVTQQAVSQMLRRLEQRVIAQLSDKIETLKARQLARLEHIYGQAMAAWTTSKDPRKKSRRKKLTTLSAAMVPNGTPALPTGVREETSDQAETSDGNFLLLETALHALADQRKLLGLDAPKRIDHTLSDQRRPLEKMSEDELAAEARTLGMELVLEGAVVKRELSAGETGAGH
jgi:predicted DNA-binding protein YlxM (UPF0122 family)